MSENKFNAGLLVGAILTISVLVIVGLVTLQANAAMRVSAPDVEINAGHESELPELGKVSFKGVIEQINADSYVVSGLTFRFDMQTMISPGLAVGDLVKVKALLLPDLTRYALSIQPLTSMGSGLDPEFEFYGIVESTDSAGWLISGETVQVTAETMVDAGVVVGSLVEVEGRIVDGSPVAGKIHLEDQDDDDFESKMDEVEFKGAIEAIDGSVYRIAGKTVMTDASTEIKGMLAVGDMVKVHATLQEDGSYLAREIEKEDFDDDDMDDDWDDSEQEMSKIKFKGVVESINGGAWVVAGRTLMIDPETKIKGDPQPGDLVEVEAFLQADGVTLLAHEIEVEDDDRHDDDESDDWDDDDSRDDDHDDDKDDDGDNGDHDDDDHDDDHDEEDDDDKDRD